MAEWQWAHNCNWTAPIESKIPVEAMFLVSTPLVNWALLVEKHAPSGSTPWWLQQSYILASYSPQDFRQLWIYLRKLALGVQRVNTFKLIRQVVNSVYTHYICSTVVNPLLPNCPESVVLLSNQAQQPCLGLAKYSRATDFQLGLLVLVGYGRTSRRQLWT